MAPSTHLKLLVHLFAALAGFFFGSTAGAQSRPPNIVFFIADDLGYGDVGSFGQKLIRTPNLDRMSAGGMRFTRHYSGSPVCAPARCVLMTGRHPGHAHIRSNKPLDPIGPNGEERELLPGIYNVGRTTPFAEGQEILPAAEVTLAELLKARGYRTGGFGKWGLGPAGSEGDPLNQGFDRFHGFLCQRHAHTYYPGFLRDDGRRVPVVNPIVPVYESIPEGADRNDASLYEIYKGRTYAPDVYTEQALRFVLENRDRPFFLYYPTIVPHVALQVPDDSLSEYLGRWEDPPYTGGRGYVPQFKPRAAYAAMITRMDHEMGRIVDLIADLGLEENTIFVFTSDNGAVDGAGGTDMQFFRSNGDLRSGKGSIYEGGIRVPAIVQWKGRIAPGSESDRVTGFEDWIPTLLDLIGAAGTVPRDVDGISFAPTLRGRIQEPRPFLYREYLPGGGQQAVWMGDWKGVRQGLTRSGPQGPNLAIELYNLREDPGETSNVAARHPEIVAQIERLMRTERVPSKLFPIPVLDRMTGR